MAIAFHCEHCGKKIEAPDNTGGKWAKCPACHNKLYVPGGPTADEDIKLAPLDATDMKQQEQLMTETYKVTQEILQERKAPDEPAGVAVSASQISDSELMQGIIDYLRQTADSQLEQAETIADLIVSCGSRAVKILDTIALSEIPDPQLADIPQQVLAGLIRNLRSRIS